MASLGVPGLDDIVGGGLARNRLFLLEGVPGSGKTTAALQYLLAGAAEGEIGLYVSLSETEEELRAVAASHGWNLYGIQIREVTPTESALSEDDQNTLFYPSEVELAATMGPILAEVERLRPARVVFDSMSELRLLAGSPLRYRRQVLALRQFFSTRQCTVVLLDDLTSSERDLQVQRVVHGVFSFEQLHTEYGTQRRRLRIAKYRGVAFRGGYHDYVIARGGLMVFPPLVAAVHRRRSVRAKLSSGVEGIDALLGGGIEQGTSTLIVGAAGTGKSTIAAQFAAAAASRGERTAIFAFDESPDTLMTRCAALNIGIGEAVDAGAVQLRQVDPAELTPGEFVHAIRAAVEDWDARIVVIDSLNGYLSAMSEERFLAIQLHELLMYLGQRGVATILIGTHQGLIGARMSAPMDASYLADAVLLLRFFEAEGELRQAISVVKNRGGSHERTIREFRMEPGSISVGAILRNFRGVMSGIPDVELVASTAARRAT